MEITQRRCGVPLLVMFRYQSRKDVLLAFWYWDGFQLGWLNPNSSMGFSILCTRFTITLFSAYSSSIPCLETSAVD